MFYLVYFILEVVLAFEPFSYILGCLLIWGCHDIGGCLHIWGCFHIWCHLSIWCVHHIQGHLYNLRLPVNLKSPPVPLKVAKANLELHLRTLPGRVRSSGFKLGRIGSSQVKSAACRGLKLCVFWIVVFCRYKTVGSVKLHLYDIRSFFKYQNWMKDSSTCSTILSWA